MKIVVQNYTFNAAAKTVTFSDYGSIVLSNVLAIINSTRQTIIFNLADTSKGGTVAGNVLTLEYNTTAMSDTDDLHIVYWDDTAAQDVTVNGSVSVTGNVGITGTPTVTGSVTANAGTNLNTSALSLETTQSAIKTAVEVIDNFISGSRGLVTEDNSAAILAAIQAPIPAGDNNIGNVDVVTMPTVTVQATNLDIRDLSASIDGVTAFLAGVNGPVDQLDVGGVYPLAVAIIDGVGSQVTSFGGGTEYTEDLGAAADPIGHAVMLIRKDSPAALTSTDGDNVAQRGTNYGAAYVQIVTSAGAFVDSFGGGTEYTEDAAAAANPVGKASILVRADTPSASVTTDGDNVAQRGTNFGAAYVTLLDTSGNPVAVGGGTQYTEDAAAAANPVGTALILVREDARAGGLTTTDGDNVAARGNNKGELYVIDTDANTKLSSIDGHVDGIEGQLTTIASYLDGVEGQLTTIDGHVDGVEASLTTLAGAVSSAKVQVDIVTAPTLTVNAHAVTNAGTFAVQDSEKIADNGGFTDGTTKVMPMGLIFDEVAGTALTENDIAAPRIDSKRAQVLVIEDETTRGRRATVTAANALKVDASSVAVPVTDNSGSLTVDAPVGTPVFVRLSDGAAAISTLPVSLASVPSHAVTNAGTFAVQDSEKITDNGGFTDGTSKVMMSGYIFDDVAGTALTENDAAAARIDSKRSQVHVIEDGSTRGRYVTVTASNALKVDGSAVTQPVSGTVTASNAAGDVAHDGGDSGNPVKIGFQARQTNPTAVADADRVNGIADDIGRQVVVMGQVRDLMTDQTTTITSSTSETTILAAVASTFLDVTAIMVTNTSATDVNVDIRDTTGGSVRFTIAVKAGTTAGAVLPRPIKQATVNTNWTAQCSASVASVKIWVQAEKNI